MTAKERRTRSSFSKECGIKMYSVFYFDVMYAQREYLKSRAMLLLSLSLHLSLSFSPCFFSLRDDLYESKVATPSGIGHELLPNWKRQATTAYHQAGRHSKTARLVYTLQIHNHHNNPFNTLACSILILSLCSFHSTLSFNLYSYRVQQLIGRKLLQRRNKQKKPPCTWQWEMKLEIGMRTKCRMGRRIRTGIQNENENEEKNRQA